MNRADAVMQRLYMLYDNHHISEKSKEMSKKKTVILRIACGPYGRYAVFRKSSLPEAEGASCAGAKPCI